MVPVIYDVNLLSILKKENFRYYTVGFQLFTWLERLALSELLKSWHVVLFVYADHKLRDIFYVIVTGYHLVAVCCRVQTAEH